MSDLKHLKLAETNRRIYFISDFPQNNNFFRRADKSVDTWNANKQINKKIDPLIKIRSSKSQVHIVAVTLRSKTGLLDKTQHFYSPPGS